jgi:hypothetical protein
MRKYGFFFLFCLVAVLVSGCAVENNHLTPDDFSDCLRRSGVKAESAKPWPRPDMLKADSACSACFAALVRALYQAEEEGIEVSDRIYIGQGFQGKTLDGVGVGKCCRGANSCVMGCPPTASAILQQIR